MRRHIFGKKQLPVILPALVVLAVAGWFLFGRLTSRAQIKQVLLISIDTCRADYVSCYGFSRGTTPNIDQLAAEGVLFTNAISPAPITLPAHASMFTGTIPPYHGVHNNVGYRLSDAEVTLAEILRDKGFTTGAIVSAFVMDSQFGLNQGFDYYNDRFMAYRNTIGINERRGDETSRLALQWLDEHKDEKFFLFLHYYDPHAMYDPPGEFAARFVGNPYAGEVAFTDHCIGAVVSKLKELGLYDSTLIVVTSDHGEMLGEHGENTHAYFIYQSAVRIPLIFKVPGIGSARIDDLAGLIDILPTICAALGIGAPAHVQGKDLSDYFANADRPKDRVFYCESFTATKYDAAALLGIITGDWKYIHTTRPELYNLGNDPHELNNLAQEQPQRVDALRQQLQEILQSSVRERNVDSKIQLDSESLARIESLGYVGDSITGDFRLDQSQNKLDPKDLIEFHAVWGRVRTDQIVIAEDAEESIVSPDKYDKEKAICLDLTEQRPDFFGSHLCLGAIAMLEGNFPSAVSHFRDALSLKPDEFWSHALLGRSLGELGEFDKAIWHLQQSIALKPNEAMPQNSLGIILAHQGRFDQAIEHFHRAVGINPTSHHTQRYLGKAYLHQGQLDKAVEHCQRSLQLNPNQGEVHNLLAQVRFAQGDIRGAVASLTAAVQLKPDWPAALNNLALIKATADDSEMRMPEEAIRLAQQACQLTEFKNPKFLVTLARCYAEGGRFADAVQIAQNALELARSAGHTKNAAEIQKYIERYQESLANQSPPEY